MNQFIKDLDTKVPVFYGLIMQCLHAAYVIWFLWISSYARDKINVTQEILVLHIKFFFINS